MGDRISGIGSSGGSAVEMLKLKALTDQHRVDSAKKAAGLTGGEQRTDAAQQFREKEATKAATQFEGLLLKQMFASMWAGVPKGGALSGSSEEQIFRDMLTDTLAVSMSETQSLGIKELVKREMMRREQKS